MGTQVLSVALLAGIGFISVPVSAKAQPPAFGYVYVSPMAASNIGIRSFALGAGVGGELWAGGGISLGGELGVVHFPAVEQRSGCCSFDSASSGSGLLVSANASRHFGSEHAMKWRPFATGGLSFEPGAIGMFNAGVGVDRWISPHVGLRLEVRDQFFVGGDPVRPGSLLLGFRGGLVFR